MNVVAKFCFDRFVVEPAQRRLVINGEPAKVGGRAFDLLIALIERRNRVVSKRELLDIVWPGIAIEEGNLQVQIFALRKILGAAAIATIPGRGYQFAAQIEGQDPPLDPGAGSETRPSSGGLRADAAQASSRPTPATYCFGKRTGRP